MACLPKTKEVKDIKIFHIMDWSEAFTKQKSRLYKCNDDLITNIRFREYYFPIEFTCFANLLFKLLALFLCQVFFLASLSIIATTLGRNVEASDLLFISLNLEIAVLADFL